MNSEEKNGKYQHLVDHVFELFGEIEKSEYREQKIKIITEARKIYEQIADDTNFPYKDASNLVLPLTTIAIDNLEPRLVAALVGKDPMFVGLDMEGTQKKDEHSEIIEDWYNSELKHTVKIRDVARNVVHSLLTEGTVYPLSRYALDDVIRRDFVFDEQGNPIPTEDGMWQEEDKKQEIFRGGRVDFVEFTDMYVPDDATDWEKTDFIRVVRPTYAELQRIKDKSGYININEDLLMDQKEEIKEEDQTPAQKVANVAVHGKKVIECLEAHISYIYREEGEEEEDAEDFTEERIIATIAKDSKILIRLKLLREINFKNEHIIKRIRMYPERGRAYGMSLYEKMKSIQDGASELFNMVLNIAYVVMMPWFFYENKTDLPQDVEIIPGRGVRVDDTSSIVFPKFNINPNQYLDFIHLFVSLWEKATSIGDMQIGLMQEKERTTAAEAMAVLQEGNIKHNYQSEVFKEEFISLLRTMYDLYYQYMPMQKTYIYKGEEVQIPRASMRRSYKFKIMGSSDLVNKVVEQKNSEDMYTLLRQDSNANPIKLLTDIVESRKPDENPEDYVNPVLFQISQVLEAKPEMGQVIMKAIQDTIDIARETQGIEDAA